MDELTAVRRLLHVDTPTPERIQKARAPLEDAMRTGGGVSRSGSVRSRIAAPPRWSPWWPVAGTGLGAAILVAIVALAIAPPADDRPPPSGTGAPPTAQEFLLAAATDALQEPDRSGGYWHVKRFFELETRLDRGYAVTTSFVSEDWYAAAPNQLSFAGYLDLGTRPSGPTDEAAWRADGSPTEWRLDGRTLTTQPQHQPQFSSSYRSDADPGSTRQVSYLGELALPLDQLRALPTDPDRLRDWFDERIQSQMARSLEDNTLDEIMFSLAVALLADTPAPPAVRAAGFRLLAAMTGMQSGGETRDRQGRTGTKLVYGERHGTREILIERSTSQVLATRYIHSPDAPPKIRELVPPGEIGVTLHYLTAGWTDATPQPPTAP